MSLLVGGHDSTGPHLFHACPSGNYYDYYACALGARCQAATSFFERNKERMAEATEEELVTIAFDAVKATMQDDVTMSRECMSVAVIDVNGYRQLNDEQVDAFVRPE